MRQDDNLCKNDESAISSVRRRFSDTDAFDKLASSTDESENVNSSSLTEIPLTVHIDRNDRHHFLTRASYNINARVDRERKRYYLSSPTFVSNNSNNGVHHNNINKSYDKSNYTKSDDRWNTYSRRKNQAEFNAHNKNTEHNGNCSSDNSSKYNNNCVQSPACTFSMYIHRLVHVALPFLEHIEVSYSSTLLFLWALLLVYLSCVDHYYAHGIAILALSSVALTSRHGESRLLLPLVFLSEMCLARTLHKADCELQFYASMLLSYFSLLIYHPEQRSETGSIAPSPAIGGIVKKWLFASVGVALACSMLQQPVVLIGLLAYVIIGGSFYWRLDPLLGNNEALLVGSFVGFVFCDACTNNNLSNDGGTTSVLYLYHTNEQLTTSQTHVASRDTMVFAAAMMMTLSISSQYCLVPIAANSKSSGKRFSQTRMTIVFWTAVVVFTSFLCIVTSYQFKQNVILWLISYLYTNRFRRYTLLLWFVCIPTIIVVGDYLTRGLRKTVRRKLFHLIAVLAFTPAALIEPSFLAFALSTATSIAVVIETARVFHVYGTDAITTFTSQFIDDRDSVTGVVRTHIYLLFGLGISVFMQYRYVAYTTRMLSPAQVFMEMCINVIPGIISLGVVDASAAIIGSSFLRSSRRVLGRYLKNSIFTERANTSITHKTTTGTLGGLLCGMIFWFGLLYIRDVPFTLPVLYSFSMIVVCSLTECFMDGVDNLQMPLVALGAVNSLFALLVPNKELWSSLP